MAGQTVQVSVLADTKPFAQSMGKLGGFTDEFAGKLKGLAVAAAGAFAVDKVVGFAKEAVGAASDLQQSVGGVQAVFGKSSDAVNKFAQQAASAVGLSQNSYNELATVIGSQLKNAGVPMDQIAGKTNGLIKQGADMAAVFGGPVSDAVDAISSALKGERDPIERYGVSLNQNKINAEAAALGFKKLGGQYDTNAQQAATLALITKQTAATQGQFGAQTNTLAEQQQILGSQFTNLKATLGSALLPVLTAGATLLTSTVLPAFMGLANQAGPAIASFFGALPGFFSAIQPALQPIIAAFQAFGPVIVSAFSQLAPLFLTAATNLSPLGALFQALTPVLPQIATVLGTLAATLAGVLAQALAIVVPLVQNLITIFSGIFVAIMPTVVAFVQTLAGVLATLAPAVLGVVAAVAPLIVQLVGALAPIISQLVNSVLPPLGEAFKAVASLIVPLIQILSAVLVPVIKALIPVVTAVIGAIVPIITSLVTIITGVVNVVAGIFTGNWAQAWKGLQQIVQGAIGVVVGIVQGLASILGAAIGAVINIVVSLWDAGWNHVKGFVTTVLNGVGSFISGIFNTYVSTVSSNLQKVISFFADLGGKITGALGDLGSLLVNAGKNVIQGLINGITGMVSTLMSTIGDIAGNMLKTAQNALGIHSPSTVFAEVGKFVGKGLQQGLEGEKKDVADAMSTLVGKVKDGYAKLVAERTDYNKKIKALKDRLDADEAKKQTKAVKAQEAVIRKQIAGDRKSRNAITKALNPTKKAALLATLKSDNTQLQSLAGQRDAVAVKLKKAQDNLADAIKVRDDFRDSVKASSIDLGKVVGDDFTNSTDIIGNLQKSIQQTNQLRDALSQLASMGIDKTTYQQIAEAGVSGGGLAAAQQILGGGYAAVAQISNLQTTLAAAADALGADTSAHLYQAGIDSMQGLVDGFQYQYDSLTKVMGTIADGMVKAIKDALGIHSPSRVFRAIGRFTTAGLVQGLNDPNAIGSAMGHVSAQVTNGYSAQLDSSAVANRGGGNTTIQVTVQAPVGSNPIEIGRTLQGFLDQYSRVGGRAA